MVKSKDWVLLSTNRGVWGQRLEIRIVEKVGRTMENFIETGIQNGGMFCSASISIIWIYPGLNRIKMKKIRRALIALEKGEFGLLLPEN